MPKGGNVMGISFRINALKSYIHNVVLNENPRFDFSFNDLYKDAPDKYFVGHFSSVHPSEIYNGRAADRKLSEINSLIVGIENESFSGVDIRLKEDWFDLSMTYPANHGDWKTMIFTLQAIQEITGNPIIDENNEETDLDKIKDQVDEHVNIAHRQILKFPIRVKRFSISNVLLVRSLLVRQYY